MDLTFSRLRNRMRIKLPPTRKERWALFVENVQILFKTTGVIAWLVILILALMEVKRYYNIDLIPGYDSAFEKVYGQMRGTITKDVKDFE